MTERRYSEDEVAEIFKRAAEAVTDPTLQVTQNQGATLGELQEIGREAGLPPELVSQAARSLDRTARSASRSFFGFPIGVGRTVELDRRVTEAEWENLVLQLRETFDARGSVKSDGAFRQWTNGNLQALLEPTPTGHRLRLQTIKGEARSLMMGGIGSLGVSAVIFIAVALAGGLGDPGALAGSTFLAIVGLVMFGFGALRLPAWARLRRRQMDAIAERLQLTVESTAPDDP